MKMRRMVMMNSRYPQYTADYISGVMSLRTPQRKSLEILDEIINSVSLKKNMNLIKYLRLKREYLVKTLYGI